MGPSQAINISGLPAAYQDSFVFLDLMKGGDAWYAGQAGGAFHPIADSVLSLDERGWPTKLPVLGGVEQAVAVNVFYTNALKPGQYVVEWQGEGVVSTYQTFTQISPNKIIIDFAADTLGGTVDDGITTIIESTDPNRVGDYVRNIKVYELQYADLIANGERYNPVWFDRVDDFRLIRTLGWQDTNFSDVSDWSRNAFNADQAFWGAAGQGAPYELLVDVANQARTDLWINIPHLATDDYIRRAANYITAHLDDGLRVYVEYSNEYGTLGFNQFQHFADEGLRLFPGATFANAQAYAVRAAEVADLFRTAFAADPGTLFPILSLSSDALLTAEADAVLNAPASVARGGLAPVRHGVKVISTDGYIGYNAADPAIAALIRDWMTDADGGFARAAQYLIAQLRTELVPQWRAGKALAERYGAELAVYEGGALLLNSTDAGPGDPLLTDFNQRFSQSLAMKSVYSAELAAWRALGGGTFAWFADVGRPTNDGDFGLWNAPGFTPEPRTDAIVSFNERQPYAAPGDVRPASTFDNGVYAAGSAANDALRGSALDDRLYGLSGNDRLTGFAGDDRLVGGFGDDRLEGGAGRDRLDGGDGSDTAIYDASPAAILIDLANARVSGGEAAGDVLISIENISGTNFDDRLIGASAANTFEGRGGADVLDGGAGDDRLFGGDGDDTLIGGRGADRLDGGNGLDVVDYSASLAGVTLNLATGVASGGDAAGDRILAVENAIGSNFADDIRGDANANVLSGAGGDDTLDGQAGADQLSGGAGADRLTGGGGGDRLDGGANIDIALYALSAASVTVDLSRGVGRGGDAQGDTLTFIEDIGGSAFNDQLIGNAEANTLFGERGDDFLRGGEGADRLYGGLGNDVIVGGGGDDILQGDGGRDVFRFDSFSGLDRIADFTDGVDKLQIFGLTRFAAAAAITISASGADTRVHIDWPDGDTDIILAGFNSSLLTVAKDFSFI